MSSPTLPSNSNAYSHLRTDAAACASETPTPKAPIDPDGYVSISPSMVRALLRACEIAGADASARANRLLGDGAAPAALKASGEALEYLIIHERLEISLTESGTATTQR